MAVRNSRLDSLRGIASLCVVFHHAFHEMNTSLVQRVLDPPLSGVATGDVPGRLLMSIASGGMAVNLFFILSGAVLIASLQREPLFNLAAVIRFAGRRILRIYPAMIATVLAFGVISLVTLPARQAAPFTLRQVLENCLLITSSVNGGTWTLQSEMLMVPVILFVAWCRSFIGNIALIAFLFWAATCLLTGAPFASIWLAVALPSFALGMLIPTAIQPNDVQRLPGWTFLAGLAAMVAIRFYFPLSSMPALIAILAISFLVVASLYHGKEESHLLDHPALKFLGKISYGLYLIHPIVGATLFPFYESAIGAERVANHYAVFGLIFAVIIAGIAIPISAYCERYLEQPFIRLGQRLFARRPRAPIELPAASQAVPTPAE
ncbi:acyltransferase [Mesorhizobium sp. B1-1-4]|uniref:acyltransferase family protein n=1 Tax=unclassified Mesorhizobium TaxID=325217 RepID=UPI00112C8C12|nr:MULTISPECIES: acyltransferase [unclassified Mesorhizobium]TPL49204.1 acyltransferase [Mesorhizobium sp. B2-4-4]TPN59992.1 acyltransferase [Mesorhizobium sp. B1-1-4]